MAMTMNQYNGKEMQMPPSAIPQTNYNTTYIQPQQHHHRQCHHHSHHDHRCHACNTPASALTATIGADGRPTYSNCQCRHCRKNRGEPYLHPLIGVPLNICTAGLGGKAFGIYRGVTMMQRERKARKAALESGALVPGMPVNDSAVQEIGSTGQSRSVSELDATSNGQYSTVSKSNTNTNGYAFPSPVSEMSSPDSGLCRSRTRKFEMDGVSTMGSRHAGVSEMDGSPVEPPTYSQIMSGKV